MSDCKVAQETLDAIQRIVDRARATLQDSAPATVATEDERPYPPVPASQGNAEQGTVKAGMGGAEPETHNVETHDEPNPACAGQWCCGCAEHPIGKPWGWNYRAWEDHNDRFHVAPPPVEEYKPILYKEDFVKAIQIQRDEALARAERAERERDAERRLHLYFANRDFKAREAIERHRIVPRIGPDKTWQDHDEKLWAILDALPEGNADA